MKKPIIILAMLCMFICSLKAQSLFTAISSPHLSTDQQARYNKILNRGHLAGLRFISTHADSTVVDTSGFLVNLPGFFPHSIKFRVNQVNVKDVNNFSISGNEFLTMPASIGPDTQFDGYSDILIVKSQGILAGRLTVESESYELFDLTGGIQVIAHIDNSWCSALPDCGTSFGNDTPPAAMTTGECTDNVIKILCLYTPSASASEANMNAKAAACVADLNSVWNNSAINYNVQLAGVEPISFIETASTPTADLNSLASNPTVQNLRNQYRAEVVVIFTGANIYSSILFGDTKEVGASFAGCYSLVDISQATTGRHTFAHEVSHQFGARHESGVDLSANNTHAHLFTNNCHWRFNHCYSGIDRITVMHTIGSSGPNSRIPNVSNPNVWFGDATTGVPFHNNAQAGAGISTYQPIIAQYYNDANNPEIDMVRINCSPYWNGDVTHFCPDVYNGPYTYNWYCMPLIQLFMGLFSGWIPPRTFVTSGNNTWVLLPQPFEIVFCDILDVNNNLAWGGAKLVQGVDASGNCIGYRTMSPASHPAYEAPQSEVFPNPNNGVFSVQLSNADEKAQISLYDILGRQVESKKEFKLDNSIQTIDITPTAQLKPGIYFVGIKTADLNETKRIIVE